MEKVTETIKITGMTCTGCARTLEIEFKKINDIDFLINFEEKSITVQYFREKHTREDFERAIESHGYGIQEKEY